MPKTTPSNNLTRTPSERPMTRATNTAGALSKKGSMDQTTFDSPGQSLNQEPGTDSTSDESGALFPAFVQDHSHVISDSPASSAMAVHGSVPASPLMQQYDAQALGGRLRGVKHTQGAVPVWKRKGQFARAVEGAKWPQVQGEQEGIVHVEEEEEENAVISEDVRDIELGNQAVKNGRIIAIDFDDVCCQCMAAYCEGHNERWGSDLTVDDMESYFIHQNKGWGTLAETNRKIKHLEQGLPNTKPVPGFAPALRKLHDLGHPIHIVTARHERCRGQIIEWLAKYGITVGSGAKDVIAEIWTTNAFGLNPSESKVVPEQNAQQVQPDNAADAVDVEKAANDERELNANLLQMFKAQVASGGSGKRKLEVLRKINASLFIDDHHGNLEPIYHSKPQIPCLLFGKYAWNMHRSGGETPVELMSYDERVLEGVQLPKEVIELVDGLERAETWADVVKWVEAWDEKSAIRDGQ